MTLTLEKMIGQMYRYQQLLCVCQHGHVQHSNVQMCHDVITLYAIDDAVGVLTDNTCTDVKFFISETTSDIETVRYEPEQRRVLITNTHVKQKPEAFWHPWRLNCQWKIGSRCITMGH